MEVRVGAMEIEKEELVPEIETPERKYQQPYVYVENNPVNEIDPYGKNVWRPPSIYYPIPDLRWTDKKTCFKLIGKWYEKNKKYCRSWRNKIHHHGCYEECMGMDPGPPAGSDRSGEKGWYWDKESNMWLYHGGVEHAFKKLRKYCGQKCE